MDLRTILVTGGAGYIGSFMSKRLLDDGFAIVIADSLVRGNREAIDPRAKFLEGNLLDSSFVKGIFAENEIDAVIHFAGYISMGESMEKPQLYFDNNVNASNNLIKALLEKKLPIVFSSTAGVYGNPMEVPIPEDHPKNPTNPYGESKLITERMLDWYSSRCGLPVACLRYFNAAGAALDGSLGENHHPELHIIPNVILSALSGNEFTLYGDTYDTPDRTAVRDYIHVNDLVEAHLLSLKKLTQEPDFLVYNVGTGNGYSNKEVFEMVKHVSGKEIGLKIADKRPGDASVLVAQTQKIRQELGFAPRYSDLKAIVESAWKWHTNTA